MDDQRAAAEAPRWLQPTARSDLQVTWHDEDDNVVISVWRGDSCVGTAPLSVEQAASLTTFLVSHLGTRASAPRQLHGPTVRNVAPTRRERLLGLLGFAPKRRRYDRADEPTVRLRDAALG